MFSRAIHGKDIATGLLTPSPDYFTQGSKKSTYREGNSTMQFDVLPANSTYPPPVAKRGVRRIEKRAGMGQLSHAGKRFKPAGRRRG